MDVYAENNAATPCATQSYCRSKSQHSLGMQFNYFVIVIGENGFFKELLVHLFHACSLRRVDAAGVVCGCTFITQEEADSFERP